MYNNLNKKIRKEYQVNKESAIRNHEDSIVSLLSKYPELNDINKKIKNEGISLSRYILKKDEKNIKLSEQRLEEYKKERDLFLKNKKIYDDYHKTSFNCQKCNDTGFISVDGLNKKCSCKIQKLIDKSSENYYLSLISDYNFDSFNLDLFSKEIDKKKYGIDKSPYEKALQNREACEEFIDNFHLLNERNLLFSGQSGVGKTFMASCIAERILTMGYTVLFQSSPLLFEMINKLKYGFKDAQPIDLSYEDLLNVNLLIIDDLGTESLTTAKLAELLNLLNIRNIKNRAFPCKTVISTNITDLKTMKSHFDERVFSRIVGDFDLLFFSGDDLRLKKAMRK
jgi:DNA replication protein DnaC